MRLDAVRIALRPRSPWEAIDLGLSLVREYSAAIWGPWFLLSLPVFAVLNALAWWAQMPWLALLAMWWLKPVFARIPLYVLSRAVFGTTPDWRETVRAQRTWGWRGLWPTLLWRRPDPLRSLHFPIDLLEGLDGARRSQRRGVLRRAISGQAAMLTFVMALFVFALFLSAWALVLMFAKPAMLSETLESLWKTFFLDPPLWAFAVVNGVVWLAESALEPFYVGGGFGLYLNRRIHIEAWDLELGFRRLSARLIEASRTAAAALALSLLLGLGAFGLASPAQAASATPGAAPVTTNEIDPAGTRENAKKPDAPAEPAPAREAAATTLPKIFGGQLDRGAERFGQSVERAYRDPQLGERKKIERWQLKKLWQPDPKKPQEPPAFIAALAHIVGLIGEYGLWLIAAIVLIFVLITAPRWLPWVRDPRTRGAAPEAIDEQQIAVVVPLPDDVPAAVRGLWQAGRRREAMALLYRACVQGLARRLGVALPPGSTEAQCLRRARALQDPAGEAGLREIVRAWQYAAYAGRWPDDAELDALLATWSRHFGARA